MLWASTRRPPAMQSIGPGPAGHGDSGHKRRAHGPASQPGQGAAFAAVVGGSQMDPGWLCAAPRPPPPATSCSPRGHLGTAWAAHGQGQGHGPQGPLRRRRRPRGRRASRPCLGAGPRCGDLRASATTPPKARARTAGGGRRAGCSSIGAGVAPSRPAASPGSWPATSRRPRARRRRAAWGRPTSPTGARYRTALLFFFGRPEPGSPTYSS